MLRNALLIVLCALTACAIKTKRAVVPALTLSLAAGAAGADVTFTAAWDLDPKDTAADYDYVLLVDGTNPPARERWRGRAEVANGRMTKTFLFSETGLPIIVTQICASVRAEHRESKNTNTFSNVVCLLADYTTPSVLTNFTLTAQ